MTDIDPGVDDGPVAARSANTVRIAAGVVAVVIAVFVVLLATRDTAQNGPNFDIVGAASPPVVGIGYDDTTFDLDQVLIDNRSLPAEEQTWVVVNFFASWCAPCEAEHPDLIRFDTEGVVRPDGTECSTELVGVTFGDTAANVEAFFDERGGDWPVLVGDTNGMVVDFGVTSAPETVIVAPNGVVWQKITGQTSYDQLVEMIPC